MFLALLLVFGFGGAATLAAGLELSGLLRRLCFTGPIARVAGAVPGFLGPAVSLLLLVLGRYVRGL